MKLKTLTGFMLVALMLVGLTLGTTPVMAGPVADASIKPVHINKASAEEFQQVKGIGPALAERIISYREANGGFKSLDEIKEVKGIGEM